MNTMTLIVLLAVIALIIFAVIGTRSTMRSERCCEGGKNCTACKTQHCTIRKIEDKKD